MTTAELAYAAGLFDGEGHVSIGVHCPNRTRKSPCHYLFIGVTSVDTGVLHWLQQRWGGSVNRKAKPSKWNHRQTHQWKTATDKAANFLRDVMPYLQIKREQAELALQFQAQRGGTGGVCARLSAATIAKRDRFKKQMTRLNGRLG